MRRAISALIALAMAIWSALVVRFTNGVPVLWCALICVFGFGCGAARSARPGNASEPLPPDLTGIVSLVGRYVRGAHACPVSETLALSNAHVADIAPFYLEPRYQDYRWSDEAGNEGYLTPVWVARSADLALFKSDKPFRRFYPIAKERPAPGEFAWFLGFNFDNRKSAYEERTFKRRVLRTKAGNLMLDEAGTPGSSGSCILNAAGEVMAINAWGLDLKSLEEIGIGPGVWGAWAPVLEEK